jgi:hypothetical protein
MGMLDGLSGVVGTLLNSFGQAVTFHTYIEAYDLKAGTNTRTPANTSARALLEDYPDRDSKGGQSGGDGVLRGDRKLTVAASAFTPTTEAKVTVAGVLYSILKIDTQYGTDNALMHVCQIRR